MPFSQKTLEFLAENRIRNSRSWYQEHRKEYEELVLRPFVEFVQKLGPAMLKIDPLMVTEPKVDRTISRIYRDTRFSRDKSLYREVMWCVFCRDRKADPFAPGFALELSPDGFRYGCGYWQTPPKVMEAVRTLILAGDGRFLKAQKALSKQMVFEMEGDCYKRSRYPGQPAEIRNWLERRGVSYMHNSRDFDLLFSEELPDRVAEGFGLLVPFYDFLMAADEYSKRPD